MFTLDATIDAVQSGKKQFVKTFVQNEKVADALNTFVDAQSEYTKKTAKIGVDTFTTLVSETTKTMQDAMKIDFTKLGESIMKAYQPKAK